MNLLDAMALRGLPVRIKSDLDPGTFFLRTRDRFLPDVVFVRHLSDMCMLASGATWHPHGHCPTWDDATECRCMLGGEA